MPLLDHFKMNGGYYETIANSLVEAVSKNCKDLETGYLADTPEKDSYSMHA